MARCAGMFGGKVLGALEDPYSASFGEKICRRFGEIVLEKKPFGDFGDLEKIARRNCGRRFGVIVR